MEKNVDVAIIGAGSAGLFALSEVKKVTQNFVLIDPGPYGSTCARTGCMPSKVLIQVANDYHSRHKLQVQGILGSDKLTADLPQVLNYVRKMRDHFVSYLLKKIDENKDHLISERAEFLGPNLLKAGPYLIQAKKIIIATGSRPKLDPEWKSFGQQILTSETLFELVDFPKSIALLGVGVIGAELGQAMSRLGVKVTGFSMTSAIGSLSDPVVQKVALEIFSADFPLHIGSDAKISREKGLLSVSTDKQSSKVEAVLASTGRIPNLDCMGIEHTGAKLNKKGVPEFDPQSMKLTGLPIFIAGDADADKSVLPETMDEGYIAGYNSVREVTSFNRRTRLNIAFTAPNIATVGMSFEELEGREFAIGEVSFNDQGRSVIKQENKGHLRVYADKKTGLLLGAEMIAPDGEHLAHLLALAIQRKLTVFEFLKAPFYHPVIEQGLKTALKDLADKINPNAAAMFLEIIGPFDHSIK
ncbi:MAG TPA: dihydrolipoyl dehydrogenase [Bacteriovoracaceae bacterium]|nr:dihydrolipoyl dehydrogenase [Bacteriovoracaceae bacterium]